MIEKPTPRYPERPRAGALPAPGDPLMLPDASWVLVVAGSPERPSPGLLRMLAEGATEVIAVDSGAEALRAVGIVPTLVLGDLDSVSDGARVWFEEQGIPANTTTWQKDATDLELALDFLAARGEAGPVVICGALGGRLDHELAVLGGIARHPQLAPVLVADDVLCVLLSSRHRRSVRLLGLGCVEATTFSVVALCEPAIVSERGMRWGLDSCELAPLSDLGISNYVVDLQGATVEVERGSALLVIPRNQG